MKKINLIHGEAIEEMKKIKSNSIDFCLTDPPYGTTACEWDFIIPPFQMWYQLNRIVKSNGVVALFGSEPFSSSLRFTNIKNYKYDWFWHKPIATNFLNANKQPLRDIESISIFYKKQTSYYPQKIKGKPYLCKQGKSSLSVSSDKKVTDGGYVTKNEGDRFPRQLQKFNNSKGDHPTQKPVDLLEYLIKTYTLKNETVLDFTMGSGSTGVACKNLNRKFIGIEKDKKYFNIAKKRIESVKNGK